MYRYGAVERLPFMSSSFNARSAVLVSRHLHASKVAVLRCPHRAQGIVFAGLTSDSFDNALTEFPLT